MSKNKYQRAREAADNNNQLEDATSSLFKSKPGTEGGGTAGAFRKLIAQKAIQEKTDSGEALLNIEDGLISFRGFIMTPIGLNAPEEVELEDWIAVGKVIRQLDDAIQWFIGDWANEGFSRAASWNMLNESADTNEGKYAQLLEHTDYAYQTLRNIASITGNIDVPRRRDTLTFSHHAEVAKLDPKEQAHYLALAEEEELSVRALREAIKGKTTKPTFIELQSKRVSQVRRKASSLSKTQRKQLATMYRDLADYLDDLS